MDSVGRSACRKGAQAHHRVERNHKVSLSVPFFVHNGLSAPHRSQGRRHELAEEEHRRQAGARDSCRQRPHRFRGAFSHVAVYLDHGSYWPPLHCQTAKIGSLVEVADSEDPEGLRVFYYLVQDLKVRHYAMTRPAVLIHIRSSAVLDFLAHFSALQD